MKATKLTVEDFKTALSTCDCSNVVAIEVDPLDTDVGVIAGCLQAVLDVEPDKRPRAVVLMFDDPAVAKGEPLFMSSAVRAWAKHFVGSRGVFDTARGLADDRILRGMAARFRLPGLLVAASAGVGRAKLLALAGYDDGLEVGKQGEHSWSLDEAGTLILTTWIDHDDAEATGDEPDASAFS
jgi:hypothetical protein